jgi:hypothetical protein
MTKTKKDIGRSNYFLNAFHGIGFGILTLGFVFVIFTNGFMPPLGLLISLASVVLLVLIAPAYDKLFRGKPQSHANLAAIWISSVLAYAVALLLLVGVVQDLMHISCIGYFGVVQSCAVTWALTVDTVIVASPLVYLLIVALPIGLLLNGRSNKK